VAYIVLARNEVLVFVATVALGVVMLNDISLLNTVVISRSLGWYVESFTLVAVNGASDDDGDDDDEFITESLDRVCSEP